MEPDPVYNDLNPNRNEIRVLCVQGATDPEATLECSLETVSLLSSPAPEYEAISYCWGGFGDQETIMLNGISFKVPGTAANAVRRFRPTYSRRILWLDALCIDQGNTDERNTQVSIMDQIYSNTQRCLVWLGESDDKTAAVLHALELISHEYYDQLHEATNGLAEDTPDDFKYVNDYFAVMFKDCTAGDLATFFERAWFSRVWVQQEVILSPQSTCHCGKYEIPWKDVYRASRWLVAEWPNIQEEFALDRPLVTLNMIWIFAESALLRVKGVALSTVLNGARYLNATDARDKFYGVLGLAERPEANEKFMRWLRVDYNKSVSTIYCDATLTSFIRQGTLTALEYVDQILFANRIAGDQAFPTWCMRLDESVKHDVRFNFGADCFSCPLPLDLSLLESCTEHQYILLQGYAFSRTSQVLVEDSEQSNAVALLRDMLTAGSKALIEQQAPNWAATLLECLSTGRQQKLLSSLDDGQCSQIVDMLTRICVAGTSEEEGIEVDADTDEDLINSLSAFYDIARRVCMNRCLFQTSDGRIGIGHPSLKHDDCVAVLAGGKYPCILRPYDVPQNVGRGQDATKRKSYRLVGLAYIPGVMNGEVVDARQESGDGLETFEIW